MKRKLLSILLVVLLLCGAVPIEASAIDETPVEVSNLSELLSATSQAEAGDTIIVTQTVNVNQSCMIGSTEKPIILKGAEGVKPLLSFALNWGNNECCWLSGMTIDGEGGAVGEAVYINTPCTMFINEVDWINCQGLYGGALNICSGTVYLGGCSFTNCSATYGGALCVQGAAICYPSDCCFEGNTATEDGGALYVTASCTLDGCTFSGNQAQRGGGVSSSGSLTLRRNKIYGNVASVAGADLSSSGTLSIAADDYSALFEAELTEGGYNAIGWYNGSEAVTMPLEDVTEETALVFKMFTQAAPEPSPAPVYVPPSYSSDDDYTPTKKAEPTPEPVSLACGGAALDKEAAEGLLVLACRYIPSGKVLTRGEAAGLIYGLLTAQSHTDGADAFTDIRESPYREAVNSLTNAGVFQGYSQGVFNADGILTWAQMITLFSRFVEPQTVELVNLSVTGHWSEAAMKTAVARGWIDDTPLDINAPVTYGAFLAFLKDVFEIA